MFDYDIHFRRGYKDVLMLFRWNGEKGRYEESRLSSCSACVEIYI